MSIIDIDSKEAATKLNIVNKYLQIILLIVFGTGIFYLYIGQSKLNDRLYDYMRNDNTNAVKAIAESQAATTENTTILKQVLSVLTENQTYLKQVVK